MPTTLIADIQRFSVHDGPGIRTVVFLKGCPLRCTWCHNPECISFEQQILHYPEKCIGCGKCAGICPAQAITMNAGKPEIDRSACIRCFCCQEFCPKGAMRVGRTVIARILNK